FYSLTLPPPRFTPFPYTTLFRSGLGQDVLEVGDLGLDLGEIVDDLLAFQGGQTTQLHVEDGLRLDVVDVEQLDQALPGDVHGLRDRKSTRLNSSHVAISYAVFCL